MSNELQKHETTPSIFSTIEAFENGQRIAKSLASSNLVPAAYQGNIPNTMVALEMATRIGISPFMVMQNLDIIKGKPSWSSTFIIAALNSCGRFEPLRFKFTGDPEKDEFGCRAVSTDKNTGEKLQSPKVTWKMVKEEGWLSKPGSKWKTMPELMFQYRAAAFFGRLFAPDILKGMHSVEEVQDFTSGQNQDLQLEQIQNLFMEVEDKLTEDDKVHIEHIIKEKESASYQKVLSNLQKLRNEQNG